ncbi:MAG: carboxypeptidase-like regulatory domain-containing protein [Chitinophagaceae bacterium]
MKKTIFVLALLTVACLPALAQPSLQQARKKSWQCLVYRIPADTAARYIQKTIASPDHYLQQQPVLTAWADSLHRDALPVGNYLVLSVVDNELVAEVFCRSNLQVLPVNNQRRVLLEVKDGPGLYRSDALVRVNNKQVAYDPASLGYWVNEKKPEEALVQVAVPGDTLLMQLSGREQVQGGGWSQWWRNFSYTRTGRIVSWPVRSVKKMITTPARGWFYKRVRYRNSGYMIFSKPKYLPGDTVRFKAYLLTLKGKQYRTPLDVYLERYDGGTVSHKLVTLRPSTPGAYIHEFVLGDSLESDRQYAIAFKNSKGRTILNQRFFIEDYVLDEVASYSLRSQKEIYLRTDTLVFFAGAKDANGLALMDGRVKLYVLADGIGRFYGDRVFVPDTLWKAEKPLAINDDTRFDIPAKDFPAADLSLRIRAEFRNSNNELQEKSKDVQFRHRQQAIRVEKKDGWVTAEFMDNGQPVARKGWLDKSNFVNSLPVDFPYSEKIDPYTESYDFSARADDTTPVSGEFDPGPYTLSFTRVQQGDTAGFVLDNPERIPVHYTVFFGNTVIARGADSTDRISWKKLLPVQKAYTLQWHYIWKGRENGGAEQLAVLDKLLKTEIAGASTIYPGQTDTITVTVKDYKDRAAEKVNLAAVSYSNQFGRDIRVPEPPYLKKYRIRRQILRDNYEAEEAGFTLRFPLGRHRQWVARLGLDTMEYYRLLFPENGLHAAATLIHDFIPQLAVHAVKNGVPQEIYLLYLNRQLVYYNGVTDKSRYAFAVEPGYVKIGIRLRDRFIETDSIYLQPFYKQDVSLDIDHLPARAVVTSMPDHYTNAERSLIERTTWQLPYDNRTNYGYVWQGSRLVHLGTWSDHRVGPFTANDSLQFYKPGDFDFRFPFESGYAYRLTPRMARLERRSLFPAAGKIKLPVIHTSKWVVGDTILPAPQIRYEQKAVQQLLETTDHLPRTGRGKLLVELPRDSSFRYAVLYRAQDTMPIIQGYNFGYFLGLQPGMYRLILVTHGFSYLVADSIAVQENGTLKLRIVPAVYTRADEYMTTLMELQRDAYKRRMQAELEKERTQYSQQPVAQRMPLPAGNAGIAGQVWDEKGKAAIPGASVVVKGFSSGGFAAGTATGYDGRFSLLNLREGSYVLLFSAVGYESKEIRVTASEGATAIVNIGLQMSSASLNEVVVVGYGIARRKELTTGISIAKGEAFTGGLQGRVAGVEIHSAAIRIRGASSFAAKPLYIIDGVAMDELPEGFEKNVADISVLADSSATALYGSRGGAGAVIITTKGFMPKQLRDQFRDYAFWKPNLLTDENGVVKFTVTYPDNITGWQTYVVGMDRKKRITRASTLVRSFKPLLARLSVPQFLVQGDSAMLIGKTVNYTTGAFRVSNVFTVNGQERSSAGRTIEGSASGIEQLWIQAGPDTVTAQYTVTASTGYSDGEQRRIPVVRKGIEEAIGNFWMLNSDTTVSFMPDSRAQTITIHAQNNTLDVLLDEIDHLKKYPYFCMEQTASKLTGLVMEKRIREVLKQPFRNEKELQKLLTRLQKAQLYEGAWSWWEGGQPNLAITVYVTQVLLQLRGNTLVETNIRNALLYLQQQLSRLRRDELLSALFALSEASHVMDYNYFLGRLPFDSLTVHQQWQVVRIRQQQQLEYNVQLNRLMAKRTATMTGGLYWGEEGYRWDRNRVATTVLAYQVLEKEGRHTDELQGIIRFFLEQRKKGHWMNTVESASITHTILPAVLQSNAAFTAPAVLQVDAGTGITVRDFPFTTTVAAAGQPVTISKSGGGWLYCTAYQQVFIPDPLPVRDNFRIDTWFEHAGERKASLVGGEKVKLKIEIEALKDAEYVQVEIPIPAGCTYGEKKQEGPDMHREFLKDKAVFFIEAMSKGKHVYEIELEPRYTGVYHLNPARAELMYFPVFYGRNEQKKINIGN